MNHNHPLWLQQDLERFLLDEQRHYGTVSLAEECSCKELEREFKPLRPTDMHGPPDWLNPHNGAHQRNNRHRDWIARLQEGFRKIQTESV
jgi:hypothetical protein